MLKKLSCFILSLVVLVTMFPKDVFAKDLEVVDTSHQKYTYEEMMEDIVYLCENSEHLEYDTIGKSVTGKDIPVLILGNKDAEIKIMVQASIHSREYMSTQLVMKMVEYIVTKVYDARKPTVLTVAFRIVYKEA